MIVGTLQEVSQQCDLSSLMQKALDFLRNVQVGELPDGRIDIDGTNVYAIVQSYTSSPSTEPLKFEAHRKYIDIQYLITGRELIGWAHLDKLMTTIPYNDVKDALYGVVSPENVTFVHYAAGQAVVLYPSDAHAPGLAWGNPAYIKKIVLKVIESP
jgi:biofilm protein TabA